MRRRGWWLGLVGLVVGVSGCGWVSELFGGGELPPAPGGETRIVSLVPAITETVGALGAEDLLVGRSDWCDHPPSVEVLPAVGSSLTPNLEAVAGLQPTHVLVDGSHATSESLAALGEVEALPWLTAAEAARSVRRLGALVGQPEPAEALALRYEAFDQPAPAEGPRVLLSLTGADVGQGEVWFLKPGSLHGQALHLAGARNALEGPVEGAPSLSLEALVALDPEVVIVVSPAAPTPEDRAAIESGWGELSTLSAVREGRVGVVGAPGLLGVGPRMMALPELLSQELGRLGVAGP